MVSSANFTSLMVGETVTGIEAGKGHIPGELQCPGKHRWRQIVTTCDRCKRSRVGNNMLMNLVTIVEVVK